MIGNSETANSSAINENANILGALKTNVDASGTDIGNLQTGVTNNNTAIVSAASSVANVNKGLNTNRIVITSASP